jgi:hypothetical protein
MNKNNFFVKLAYFYFVNLKDIKEYYFDIWDILVDDVLPGLLKIVCRILFIIHFIISFILPYKQIFAVLFFEYLTLTDEEKKVINPRIKEGYYLKKDVRKIKQAIKEAQNA